MGMSLSCVTLTGADESVDPSALEGLRREHPSVEWGILVSSKKNGQSRYPSEAWIESFLHACKGKKSLHLCEGRVADFVAGDKALLSLAQNFNRMQVNLFSLARMPEVAALDAAARSWGKPLILQYNRSREKLVQRLTAPNIQILFDESAGRGQVPDAWPKPLPERKCGYAGGLGLENIKYQLPLILKEAGKNPVWIDMESSLRDSADNFDVKRARETLRAIEKIAPS